jgi:hypothetical protein
VTVLSDTRSPDRLHLDGVFTLGEELLQAGTGPQVAARRCSGSSTRGFDTLPVLRRRQPARGVSLGAMADDRHGPDYALPCPSPRPTSTIPITWASRRFFGRPRTSTQPSPVP